MELRWWPWARPKPRPPADEAADRERLMRSADEVLATARAHQQHLDAYLRGLEEELRRLRGPYARGGGCGNGG